MSSLRAVIDVRLAASAKLSNLIDKIAAMPCVHPAIALPSGGDASVALFTPGDVGEGLR